MKYEVSYTKKDGRRIEGQVFTAQRITQFLIDLEAWGASNIVIKSIDSNKSCDNMKE